MNLCTSQPAKRGAVNAKRVNLVTVKAGRTKLGRAAAFAFLLLPCFGAFDGSAAQNLALPVKYFAQMHNAAIVPPVINSATSSDQLHITVGRSVMLTSVAPLRRIYVGNPVVLQTYTSGSSEIVLTAKTAGVSSMVLWDDAGGHRMYTVSADIDPEALRASFNAAFLFPRSTSRPAKARFFLPARFPATLPATLRSRWLRCMQRTLSTRWLWFRCMASRWS